MLRNDFRIGVLTLALSINAFVTIAAFAAEHGVDGFQIGADISSLPQVEAAGGAFGDGGRAGDLPTILKNHGITHARLRIWNAPRDGWCGLEKTLALAKRLKAAGMPWLLDFHYSDTWADPGKQVKPAAWANLHGPELEAAVFDYTRSVIRALDAQETPPEMAQIGNEITPGMLWEDGRLGGKGAQANERWQRLARLLKAGIRGVNEGRAGKTPIRVMIHLDCGADNGKCRWFIDQALAQGVSFDVLGLSYYPWWHGSLEQLRGNLNDLSGRYKKDIAIVETGYPWTPRGMDKGKTGERFEATVAGQKAFLAEVMKIVREIEGGRGKGVYYWEPAWVATPKARSMWPNRGLFDNEGNLLESIEGLGGPAGK